MAFRISDDFVAEDNAKRKPVLDEDFTHRFNDSKYGDDDLDSGSIKPFQLFLIFNELVDAELERTPGFNPSHMLDQSHTAGAIDPVAAYRSSGYRAKKAEERPAPAGRLSGIV